MPQTVVAILEQASKKLIKVSDSAVLEAEILLAHLLQKPRSYLHTWPLHRLKYETEVAFFAFIERRLLGEPVAYLIGHKEFWSLDLLVTPDVLIPRPETELLVELVLQLIRLEKAVIADLGTGSGAIALALAKEKPQWRVVATDVSQAALTVAKKNALRSQLERVEFYQGAWCDALPSALFDAIVSNPPYIAKNDPHLQDSELQFEPTSALVANENGLQDLKTIIVQAKSYLKPGGLLLLEHGFEQAEAVATFFAAAGYTQITLYHDLSGLDRVTIATR